MEDKVVAIKDTVFIDKDVWDRIVNKLEILDLLKHSKCHTEKHIGPLSFMLTSFSVEGEVNIKKIEEWYYDK